MNQLVVFLRFCQFVYKYSAKRLNYAEPLTLFFFFFLTLLLTDGLCILHTQFHTLIITALKYKMQECEFRQLSFERANEWNF